MGAHPYWYFVKHENDVDAALQKLRQREFKAGRYNPVIPFLDFPLGPHSPAPGARHASIQDALADSDADGTRSILDLAVVSEEPDFGAVAPVPDDVLLASFGTMHPTRQMLDQNN